MEHDVFQEGSVTFLIDTGSQLNLLKRAGVTTDVPINTDIIYNLTGIGSSIVPTCGEVILQIYGQDMKFQVVDEAFPGSATWDPRFVSSLRMPSLCSIR